MGYATILCGMGHINNFFIYIPSFGTGHQIPAYLVCVDGVRSAGYNTADWVVARNESEALEKAKVLHVVTRQMYSAHLVYRDMGTVLTLFHVIPFIGPKSIGLHGVRKSGPGCFGHLVFRWSFSICCSRMAQSNRGMC